MIPVIVVVAGSISIAAYHAASVGCEFLNVPAGLLRSWARGKGVVYVARVKGFLTTREAAAVLNASISNIQAWCRGGRLEATKMGGIWLIPVSELGGASQPGGSRVLHQSGYTGHQWCPRLWYLSDRDWGLGWKPRYPESPLHLGSLTHEALAASHRGFYAEKLGLEPGVSPSEAMEALGTNVLTELNKQPFVIESEVDRLLKLHTLGVNMMRGYEMWWAQDSGPWADKYLEYRWVEDAFEIEYQGWKFGGKLDGLAYHKLLDAWYVVEHKTTRSVKEREAGIRWEVQPRLYMWAAQVLTGQPIAGVLYNLIQRSDPFKVPILKNGMPTMAESRIGSTIAPVYEYIARTCADEMGMKEKDLKPYLDFAARIPNKIYKRVSITFSPTQLETALEYMMAEGHKMEETLEMGWSVEPHQASRCARCPMGEVCLMIDDDVPTERIQQYLEHNFIHELREEDDDDEENSS